MRDILKSISILNDFHLIRQAFTGLQSAVTIGNFDGCHLGHQGLIRAVTDRASTEHLLPVAMSFTPRPEAFFRGEPTGPTLFTDAQKTRAMAELGIECFILQNFGKEFSLFSHEDFFDIALKEYMNAKFISIGRDFRFGRGRIGHAAWLQNQGSNVGIAVAIGCEIYDKGDRISSTRIRDALSNHGDVALVQELLGRPYLIEGTIKRGDQIGRTWGFPTANLDGILQLVPSAGVYAGWVWLPEGKIEEAELPPIINLPSNKIPAVFSVGLRPTLNLSQPQLRVEAHLLGGTYGENSLYGLKAGYYLTHRLRGDIRFPSIEALKEQIANDVAQARKVLIQGGL